MEFAFIALIVVVMVISAYGLGGRHGTRRTRERSQAIIPATGRHGQAGHDPRRSDPGLPREPVKPPAEASKGEARKARFTLLMGIDQLPPQPAPASPEDPELWDEAIRSRILPMAKGIAVRVRARSKLYRILTSPSLNAEAMNQAILEDPELAGEILRSVNSPYYGLVQPVASVTRAILYLGHLEVRNIIWRVCMRETSGDDLTAETQEAMDHLWHHSFVVSRGSYVIARTLGVGDPDHIATAALLHDIGKSFFLRLQPSEYMALMEDPALTGGDLRRAEQSLFGCDHARLGYEVVRMWGLPDKITQLVGKHHHPEWATAVKEFDDPRSLMVVYLADLLHHTSRPRQEEGAERRFRAPADGWIRLLGLKGGLEDLCSDQLLRIYAADAAVAADAA